jgi:ferrous iron transport protein B
VTAAIFAKQALFFTWMLVSLNIIMLGIAGIVISKYFFKDVPVPFIMELPLYHNPDFKTIGVVVWVRTWAFIKKAGSVIFVFSIILWIMSNVPGGNIEQSMLARIGHIFEPVGAPIGLDWKLMVALFSSIIAKENSVATLGVLFNAGDQGLMAALSQAVNQPSALSFLIILMLFIPCAPTMTVMKQEMGGIKWLSVSFLFMLVLSYGSAAIVYRLAILLGL